MRIERTLRERSQLVSKIDDAFSLARMAHLSHDALTKCLVNRVYNTKSYGRLPQWGQSHIKGYVEAQLKALYRYELVWKVRLHGDLIDSADVPRGQWHKVESGAHVWRGTDKVFH